MPNLIETPAIKGTQANRPQYAAVWSLHILFRLTDESLIRAIENRDAPLDRARVKAMADRFTAEAGDSLDTSFLLGILGHTEFVPSPTEPTVGTLRIDPTSRIEILDGVYRIAALRMANLTAEQRKDFNVPVILTPLASEEDLLAQREALMRSTWTKRRTKLPKTRIDFGENPTDPSPDAQETTPETFP